MVWNSAMVLFRSWMAWALCAVVLVEPGCSGPDPLSSPTGQRLKGLITAYLDYAVARGAGPADQISLLKHMQSMEGFDLGVGTQHVSTADDPLVSPRDGKPFVIHYGCALSHAENAPPIAYECTPHDGQRFVGFANGRIECINEDDVPEILIGSL